MGLFHGYLTAPQLSSHQLLAVWVLSDSQVGMAALCQVFNSIKSMHLSVALIGVTSQDKEGSVLLGLGDLNIC